MAGWSDQLTKGWNAWKDVAKAADRPAGLLLAGDPELVALAVKRFSEGGSVPAQWTQGLDALTQAPLAESEELVVFVRPEEEDTIRSALPQLAARGGVVVAVAAEPGAEGAIAWYRRRCSRVAFAPTKAGWAALYRALVDAAGDQMVPLGRRFPVLREAASQRIVRQTAGQNALIGATFMVPGASMPVMTLNQVKMLLSLAAIHGQKLDWERALELASVVGAGFAFRALGREAAGLVPGLGWAVKGAVGYSGTTALGTAALKYFGSGAPASVGRAAQLAQVGRVAELARVDRMAQLAKRIKR